ncbi:MAG: GGDEF domain-containing protein [Bacillota bacterium]
MRLWTAGMGGLLLFLLGLAAGKFYPLVNILWLVYTLGLTGITLLWVRHINKNLDNLLLEVPDPQLLRKSFAFDINEFSMAHRNMEKVYKKLQLAEFNLLNQKARQAGENFNLMLSNTTDSLTGVPNRRELDRYLEKVAGKMNPMSVIMVDIDHFKKINDTYGHAAGDMVLQHFASVVKGSVRPADFLGRYGGEEFMVICGAELEEAAEIAERVRQVVSETPVKVSDNQTVAVTASMGVAEYRTGDTMETMVQRADEALYRAKQDGRNMVKKESEQPCAG